VVEPEILVIHVESSAVYTESASCIASAVHEKERLRGSSERRFRAFPRLPRPIIMHIRYVICKKNISILLYSFCSDQRGSLLQCEQIC
jgi:hypothetical protein